MYFNWGWLNILFSHRCLWKRNCLLFCRKIHDWVCREIKTQKCLTSLRNNAQSLNIIVYLVQLIFVIFFFELDKQWHSKYILHHFKWKLFSVNFLYILYVMKCKPYCKICTFDQRLKDGINNKILCKLHVVMVLHLLGLLDEGLFYGPFSTPECCIRLHWHPWRAHVKT